HPADAGPARPGLRLVRHDDAFDGRGADRVPSVIAGSRRRVRAVRVRERTTSLDARGAAAPPLPGGPAGRIPLFRPAPPALTISTRARPWWAARRRSPSRPRLRRGASAP